MTSQHPDQYELEDRLEQARLNQDSITPLTCPSTSSNEAKNTPYSDNISGTYFSDGADNKDKYMAEEHKGPNEMVTEIHNTHNRTESPVFPSLFDGKSLQMGYMLFCVVLATALAIGHHFVSRFLSGKSTRDYSQEWVKNLSLAAAFLIKSLLAAGISLAFKEIVWRKLSTRYMEVRSIDHLFKVQREPTSFLSLKTLQAAPLALLVAAIQWSIPLAAIISPGTLSTHISIQEAHQDQCLVPTFNSTLGELWFPGGLGVKVHDTPKMNKLSFQTAISGSIAYVPSSTFCGTNCSYTQEFVGPEIACHYNDTILPQDLGLKAAQLPQSCFSNNETECKLYYGWKLDPSSATDKKSRLYWGFVYAASTGPVDDPTFSIEYKKVICTYSYATYHLFVEYIDDRPTYNITTTPYLLPESFIPNYNSYPDSDLDSWHIDVTSRGLFEYFFVVWFLGSSKLVRTPSEGSKTTVGTDAKIYFTPLLETREDLQFEPSMDFTVGIPEMFHNFTISTFLLNPNYTTAASCLLQNIDQIYIYEAKRLVIVYVTAIILTLMCILGGVLAMRENGAPAQDIFSRLLITTRNVELDTLVSKSKTGKMVARGKLKLEKVGGKSVFVVEH